MTNTEDPNVNSQRILSWLDCRSGHFAAQTGTGTGPSEALYRTKDNRWILQYLSQASDDRTRESITEAQARDWLVRNAQPDAIICKD